MEPTRWHVFVCTQVKPADIPACSARGSLDVLARLRELVAAKGLTDDVLITECGSIGLCELGPNMIVYPGGTWYSGVGVDDVNEIVEQHLINGKIVDRLAWKDEGELRKTVLETRAKMMAMMKERGLLK